jgi:hypothetical protein
MIVIYWLVTTIDACDVKHHHFTMNIVQHFHVYGWHSKINLHIILDMVDAGKSLSHTGCGSIYSNNHI